MHILLFSLGAAVAMFFTDIIGDLMTQAIARNRGILAGVLDTVGWILGISTTFLSVDALMGNSWALKISVIGAVSVANMLGSIVGVRLGERYIEES